MKVAVSPFWIGVGLLTMARLVMASREAAWRTGGFVLELYSLAVEAADFPLKIGPWRIPYFAGNTGPGHTTEEILHTEVARAWMVPSL